MEAKFTPGPWDVEEETLAWINNHQHNVWLIASPSTNTGVAVVILPEEDDSAETREERVATANLIAAAPEMYEALEGGVEMIIAVFAVPGAHESMFPSTMRTMREHRDCIKALLAKARGES